MLTLTRTKDSYKLTVDKGEITLTYPPQFKRAPIRNFKWNEGHQQLSSDEHINEHFLVLTETSVAVDAYYGCIGREEVTSFPITKEQHEKLKPLFRQ